MFPALPIPENNCLLFSDLCMDGSRSRFAPRHTDRSSGVRSVHSRVRRSGDDSGLPLAGRSSGVRSVDYYCYVFVLLFRSCYYSGEGWHTCYKCTSESSFISCLCPLCTARAPLFGGPRGMPRCRRNLATLYPVRVPFSCITMVPCYCITMVPCYCITKVPSYCIMKMLCLS